MYPINNKRRLADSFQICKALALNRSHSRNAAIWAAATSGPEEGSRSSFRRAILPIKASPAAWLVAVGEKNIFGRRAYPSGIVKILGQPRFFEVHNIFASSRSGT